MAYMRMLQTRCAVLHDLRSVTQSEAPSQAAPVPSQPNVKATIMFAHRRYLVLASRRTRTQVVMFHPFHPDNSKGGSGARLAHPSLD